MPRQKSAEEHQELGKQLYKQKQFEKALGAFNDALEACILPDLGLYDQRAATYDKLEQYPKALNDGRKLIQLDKEDPRGYLRTAQILLKMDKPEKALSIYQLGLRNVPSKDKNYILLQRAHDKWNRRLAPAVAMDPLSVLPNELASEVFSHLTFRNLVNCLRISKGWRHFIESQPRLWSTLDLSEARTKVSPGFVLSSIRRSQGQMKAAVIRRIANASFRTLAVKCKSLQALEILGQPEGQISDSLVMFSRNAFQLDHLKVHIQLGVSLDTISRVLHNCASLRHVEFLNVVHHSPAFMAEWRTDHPYLQTIRLEAQKPQPFEAISFPVLLKRAPNLKHCILKYWQGLQYLDFSGHPLETLHIDSCIVGHSLKLPPSIRSLHIKGITGPFREITDQDYLLPCLLELDLSHNMKLSALFHRFIESYRRSDNTEKRTFIRLSLNGCYGIRQRDLMTYLQNPVLNGLLELGLAGQDVDDQALHELKGLFCNLERINLSKTRVTGAGIRALVRSCHSSLQWIGLDQVTTVQPDAVEWARSQGVTVSRRMAEPIWGAKLVRQY